MSYKPQNSLPKPKVNRNPTFTEIKIAEVTSNKDYDTNGVLYARFTKGGTPCPVYVYENGMYAKPEEGDSVIVGFAEGNKTHPVFLGYEMNAYQCANYFRASKQGITVQFPLDTTDAEDHMADDTNEKKRAYVRFYDGAMELFYPAGDGINGTTIKLQAGALEITVAAGSSISIGGSTPVARQGDTITVNVGGTDYTGTITGGSSSVKVG